MNHKEFEYIFNNLTNRRKEVLQRILSGSTDAEIATAMDIGEPSVRKFVERICEEFGLSTANSQTRRYKRSELVTLFARYKPELLTEQQPRFINQVTVVDRENTVDTNITEFVLHLLTENQPILEDLKKLLNRFDFNEQEKTHLAKSLNKAGYQYYIKSDFPKAISYLELAIELQSNYGIAHYNLGSAYEKLDNWQQASHHYKIATQYQNRGADAAINNLARLQILQGNNAAVVEMIAPVLAKVKDNTVKAALYKNLGWAYFQQNCYQQAKQYLLTCLELVSDYAPAYAILAKIHESEGDQPGAIALWRKFLEFHSRDQEIQRVCSQLPELEIWKLDALRTINFHS
jgi:tetratricopeptide (TPR) repeat protein